MKKCKNNKKQYYKGAEPSPRGNGYCASGKKIGEKQKGKNGKYWIVAKRKNGTKYWKQMEDKIRMIVVLMPFLIRNGNDYDDTHRTHAQKINRLIDTRLKKDYTNVKGIFDFYYDVTGYKYERGKIYVTLKKKSNKKFTIGDQNKIRYEIVDPHNIGPDTWMEGDITIIDDKDLKRLKIKGDTLELGVDVIDFQ